MDPKLLIPDPAFQKVKDPILSVQIYIEFWKILQSLQNITIFKLLVNLQTVNILNKNAVTRAVKLSQ